MSYLTANGVFKTRLDAFRYHRKEGFLVGIQACQNCGCVADFIFFPTGADPDITPVYCQGCGKVEAALIVEDDPTE